MDQYFYRNTCYLLLLISGARGFVLLGSLGLAVPNMSDIVFIVIGLIAHKIIFPYTGFRLFSFKMIKDKSYFVPFKKWMVSGGNRELFGHEYETLLKEDLSSLGIEKLELIKSQGKITVYDQVNLILFEEQIGRPTQSANDDENLRNSIKSSF